MGCYIDKDGDLIRFRYAECPTEGMMKIVWRINGLYEHEEVIKFSTTLKKIKK